MFETRQPKHVDFSRLTSGGASYRALQCNNPEVLCSWCDDTCTVQLVHNRDHNAEYACDKHADQYFSGAQVPMIALWAATSALMW